MTLQEFIKKYLGKQVEYHSYGAGALYQCTDLVNQYTVDVLGYDPIIGTNAKDFKDRYNKEQFTWIPNTPEAIPQKGDIVVWDKVGKYVENGVTKYAGHVAIVKDASINQFTSLDQNWSKVQRVTEEVHNYTNVSGWLHPKSNGSTTGEPPVYVEISPSKKLPDEFYKINEFKKLKDRKIAKGDEAFDTLMSILLTTDEDRNRAIAELEEQKKHFDEEVEALNKTRKELLKEQKEAFDSEREAYETRIKELEEQLSISNNDMAKKEIGSPALSLNKTDAKKWGKNTLIFLAPVLLSALLTLVNEIPKEATWGIIALFVVNVVIDLVRKFISDNSK